MASRQQHKKQEDEVDMESLTQGGTGPEYEYPTTKKNEAIPVVEPSSEDAELLPYDPAKAPGEDAPPLKDSEIAREEKLEDEEAGEWTEDLAENEPRPGEVETDPDLVKPVPLDSQQ